MKISKFVSYFFHPINFPIIGALLYFLFIPKYIYKTQEYLILGLIFVGSYIFPLVLLALLKKFGMIDSYHMETVEERKFPTLLFISLSIIIGNWLYKTSIVNLLALLYFGYSLGLLLSYILLFFKVKISLHTAAVSGLIGFLIYFSYTYKINLLFFMALFFVLSGIIASARLELKAHTLLEIFLGFFLGLGSQFIIYGIYIM